MIDKVMMMVLRDTLSTDADVPAHTRRHRWTVAIAVGAALIVAVTACYLLLQPSEKQASPALTPAALTVTATAPRRTMWPDAVNAQGSIAPWEEASIGTQIGSYQLTEVRVNVGDRVTRGQVLARLNPALLRAEEAQLLARRAQADANDRRARGLLGAGGISDQEALQFATEARTASALLAAKQLELQYTTIRAPDDGTISARPATTGAVVPVGQELFRMIRRDRLEWRGELTAMQMKSARRGQMILLSLPDGTEAQARIREFAPALDGQSRLGIVYAGIMPGSRARAGMYADGAIAVGQSSALIVPAECVVIRDGRSYVMLIASSRRASTITLRSVTSGRRNGGYIEITRGLSGTERLVRRGAAFLDDGDTVHVVAAEKARS